MAKYEVVAKVDQIVTKTIKLLITGSSEEDVQAKAREALTDYPKPISVKGVERILTINSNHWIPKSIDFVSINVDPDNDKKIA